MLATSRPASAWVHAAAHALAAGATPSGAAAFEHPAETASGSVPTSAGGAVVPTVGKTRETSSGVSSDAEVSGARHWAGR